MGNSRPPGSTNHCTRLPFRDEMEEVKEFIAEDGVLSVATWLQRVGELALEFGWTPAKTRFAARRAVKGLAVAWVQTQPVSQTWTELRDGLKKEFGARTDGAQIVQRLQRKKLKADESAQAYAVRMLQMADWGWNSGRQMVLLPKDHREM